MKKMSVKREILVMIIIVVAVLLISSKVLATGTSNGAIKIPSIDTTTNSTTDTTNVTANPIVPITNTNTNTAGSTYQNTNTTTLPQTGDASDYAIFLLIVVATIIAVYAYRKVKEYNIK